MTEKEWFDCNDSEAMLDFVRSKASQRKLRLFAAGCFQRLAHLLPDERQRQAIDILEKAPEATPVGRVVQGARLAMPSSDDSFGGKCTGLDDPYFISLMLYRELVSSSTAHHATFATRGLANGAAERSEQSRLLRCILGPLPFRMVRVASAWANSKVVAIAQAIYNEHTFDKLPALAVALETAGCDDGTILNHCKESGSHIRGCWVVDILLGKH